MYPVIYGYQGANCAAAFFSQALKCFDGSENLVQVRRGMAYLLLTQQKDGSWTNAVESDPMRTYFSTVNAVWALSEPKPIGFAPSIPEITPLLELHINADIGAHVSIELLGLLLIL